MHATSLISKILVSSHEVILDNFKDKIEALQLKMNQVVDAKVTKVLPNGKAELSIKGQLVVAKTHVLLIKGETIKLQAVSEGDSKVLRLVPKSNQNTIPEGLKEMRAFGRSGLFSKLTQVLSDYLPPFGKVSPKEFKTNDLTTILKQNQPYVKLQKPVINKTDFTAGRPFDISNLKVLVENKTIPWQQKIASLIVQTGTDTSVVPIKIIEKLAEKLVASLRQEIPVKTQIPVLEQLREVVQKKTETLSVKENSIINTVVKDKSIPRDYKLLAVLSSDQKSDSISVLAKNETYQKSDSISGLAKNETYQKSDPITVLAKNQIQPAELLSVQKILLQGLKQNGINITSDILSETPVMPEIVDLKFKSIHLLKQLEALLERLSLKAGEEPDNESLKSIVKNSGLMWESKLRSVVEDFKGQITLKEADALINNDIKALATKLAIVLEGEDKNAGKILRSFVEGLEKMQILNTHSSEDSGRYLLPLPFFFNDTLKFGQLLIDLDRDGSAQQKGNDKATRVAFILEMTRLGHLKADFAIYKKSISGEFGVENTGIQSLFNQLIPGLIEKFEEKGYSIKRIGCSVISSGELAGTSLTDMAIDNPDGVINIVV